MKLLKEQITNHLAPECWIKRISYQTEYEKYSDLMRKHVYNNNKKPSKENSFAEFYRTLNLLFSHSSTFYVNKNSIFMTSIVRSKFYGWKNMNLSVRTWSGTWCDSWLLMKNKYKWISCHSIALSTCHAIPRWFHQYDGMAIVMAKHLEFYRRKMSGGQTEPCLDFCDLNGFVREMIHSTNR